MRQRIPPIFSYLVFFGAPVLSWPVNALQAQTGQADQLAVGAMDIVAFQGLSAIPLPSQTNQKFCTLVRLGPNLLAWAYVPTAAERVGDFSQFSGSLVDPQTNLPFPGNIIPTSLLPSVFAWRIAASGPSSNENCLPAPQSVPQFTLLNYVTGQPGELDLTVGPGLLSFSYTLGGAFPESQNLSVTAPLTANFAITPAPFGSANEAPAWLFVDQPPQAFQTPASVPVYALPNELGPGISKGLLTISAINVLSPPVQIEADVTVSAPSNWLSVDTTTLQPFNYLLGDSTTPDSQTINITSLGAASSFSLTTHVDDQTGNWLLASPTQGTAASTITLSIDLNILQTLERGNHFGYVDIVAPGAPNSPFRIFVTLSIVPNPDFTITPQTLQFTWNPGDSTPSPQKVSLDPVQNPTSDPSGLQFTVGFTPKDASDPAWAQASPNPAGVSQIFQVSLNGAALAGLSTGIHSGTMSLNAPDSSGNVTAGTIPVRLTVGPANASGTVTQIISQIADGQGWQTTIMLVNSDTGSAAPFTLHFWPGSTTPANLNLSLAGRGPLTDMTVSDVVPPGGAMILTTQGSGSSPLWQGWGELIAPSSVGGTAIFHTQISASQDSEAAVPVKPADGTQFTMPFDDTQGFVTSMALVNPSGTQPVSVSVTFLDENGNSIAIPANQASFQMAAREQDTFRLRDRFSGISGQRGIAQFISSGSPIAGLGLRFSPRFSFTSFEPLAAGSNTQRVAHVADGQTWQTTIRLVNLDTSRQANVTIQFFPGQDTPAGTILNLTTGPAANNRVTGSIPPGGSYTVTTQGAGGGALWQGWAQITSTASVGGLAIFRAVITDTQDSEGAVPMNASASNRFLVPFDNTAGFESSLAMVNPNATQTATITASFRDNTGQALLATNTFAITANGHQAFALSQKFALAGRSGVADFTSSLGDLFGIGLRFNPRFAFTSLPILRK
ncbi:MAG: hypothetical protein U0Q18_13180 [Bryobacteraceae bacterium]